MCVVTQEAPAPAKEKKPKATKEKKPKQAKTASRPPSFQMIKDALVALNEKGGSSPYAIAKYMEKKDKAVLPTNFKKILDVQLKNQAARGKLVKVKTSYKLSETAKKEKKETKDNSEKKESRLNRSSRATTSAPKSKKTEAVEKSGKKSKKISTSANHKESKSVRSPSKRPRIA